ncbi:MAG: HD domain-containing protein [Rhodocyclaceae bacterium]|nr:MAG: HD domain-containing protein [Rhodocyclaceae bacterium]
MTREQLDYSLSVALGERDQGTRKHCERVIRLSMALGEHIALTEQELARLMMGARLHDIGKIGIPDRVLSKPASFEADEWECMKQHPLIGERIVQSMGGEHAEAVADIVRHHHERFDGSGYPDGLSGSDIPLLSRIISLTDCYDAMAEPRPYHKARSHQAVMDILSSESGVKHDPDLLHAFSALIEAPDSQSLIN